MKKVLFIFASVFLVCFIIYNLFSSHSLASNISKEDEYYYNEDNSLNEDGTIMTNNNSKLLHTEAVDTVKDSYTVIVNKQYALPADYVPQDLVVPDVLFNFNFYDEKKLLRQVAATALEDLFNAAKEEGFTLYAISGYRSYDRQKEIYDSNIATKGEEYTNRYSAKPGHSEHQTGLSMDVSTISVDNRLEPVFAYTPEGKWLAKNAHRFGFIIRYPDKKEYITGYSYEPWHVRYVGKDLAEYLYENELTLEDYYGLEPFELETTEISYDNVIDIDTSTEKKEIQEPTNEEIEEISKEDKEKEDKEDDDKKDTKQSEDKKAKNKAPSKDTGKNNDSKGNKPAKPENNKPVETDPKTDPPVEETVPDEDETPVEDPVESPDDSTGDPEIPDTGIENPPPVDGTIDNTNTTGNAPTNGTPNNNIKK